VQGGERHDDRRAHGDHPRTTSCPRHLALGHGGHPFGQHRALRAPRSVGAHVQVPEHSVDDTHACPRCA
jgi:hypothetical protein